MNKRIQTVMSILKPKVKAFGFNKKELEGIAAKIADNLTSEEEASEEDVKAEIEQSVAAVLPYLEFGQSFANRVINDHKNGIKNDDNEDNDDAPEPSKNSKPSSKFSAKLQQKSDDDAPAWAKALIQSNEELKKEIANIKGEKIADTRKSKLEKLLKDAGTFGSRTLKSFAKMKFENDDDFEEFYSEVEEDLKSFNQERADAGLSKLGTPVSAVSVHKEENFNVLSDEEIKELANSKS